jgi:hypothetical protein
MHKLFGTITVPVNKYDRGSRAKIEWRKQKLKCYPGENMLTHRIKQCSTYFFCRGAAVNVHTFKHQTLPCCLRSGSKKAKMTICCTSGKSFVPVLLIT